MVYSGHICDPVEKVRSWPIELYQRDFELHQALYYFRQTLPLPHSRKSRNFICKKGIMRDKWHCQIVYKIPSTAAVLCCFQFFILVAHISALSESLLQTIICPRPTAAMATRCSVCNGWLNTTAGGVHNCPGGGTRNKDTGIIAVEDFDTAPQLIAVNN